MKRIVSILFHTVLFLGLLLAIDQAFVHLPMDLPGLRQSQSFYRDFRSRLLGLRPGLPGAEISVEQLIDAAERTTVRPQATLPAPTQGPVAKAGSGPPPAPGPRYLYPDAGGQLQFADRLEEIPPQFRSKAQPLIE